MQNHALALLLLLCPFHLSGTYNILFPGIAAFPPLSLPSWSIRDPKRDNLLSSGLAEGNPTRRFICIPIPTFLSKLLTTPTYTLIFVFLSISFGLSDPSDILFILPVFSSPCNPDFSFTATISEL
ncbi:hypothetical protein L873DRAFT_771293 [Choiromyces venosus 120613-1]|uniref:Secreted protein n=1 Tax=Choiromyces venosus 120613-1 TaxID=1336337 RepID=A0A3N4JWI7_9PEZI|nr:hypothetical protein L873DRAFT_771293 [Choiromyces venosus 120613-1]